MTFFVSPSIQTQLYFPLSLILLTSLLFLFPKYKGKIRTINQSLLGAIIIGFFYIFQFYKTKDVAMLGDGTRLSVEFKKGTGLLKRYVVKDIFHNMLPVPIVDGNKEYIIYVSKYELSNGQYSVLNNEVLSHVFYLIKNKPHKWYSYRHAQIFTKILENIVGIKFDLLTYPEWQIASCFSKHAPNNNRVRVSQGYENKYGLVNISNNAPEYTSSYLPTLRIGKASDTVIIAYDWIYVAGSAFETEDSLDYTIVNKNLISGWPSIRLIYRPNDVGLRCFSIIGHRCSDNNSTDFPNSIKLLSIDDKRIDEIDRYETFEELLIECRYRECIMTAMNIDNMQIFSFIHPQGVDLYDFEPVFTFNY